MLVLLVVAAGFVAFLVHAALCVHFGSLSRAHCSTGRAAVMLLLLLHLQVPCGGWRRPSAADVASGDDLAFCYLRDGCLWLYR